MAEMPTQFTEVGAEVAVLPYNAQTESVKLGKVTKVTKTRVTVEYLNPTTEKMQTAQFYSRKYGNAFGEDPTFPRMTEYGVEYRAKQLALVTDPAVPRMMAARRAFVRDRKLRDAMADMSKRATVAGAKELITMLTNWVAEKEGEESGE